VPSLRMRATTGFVRMAIKPRTRTESRTSAWLERPKRDPRPPRRVLRRHQVDRHRFGLFASYSVRAREASPIQALIYLHGGSYVNEIESAHWRFIDRIVEKTGRHLEVPIYGLAPQHSHREAFPFLKSVHDRLLHDFDATEIALAGDSAGGGLALAFAQHLVEEDSPLPVRLILIAPWLDLTLGNPALPALEETEPCLNAPALRIAGMRWANGDDPSAPLLSPMFGRLDRLPPTDIYVGTRDIFLADARDLARRGAAAGVEINLHVEEGAVHVYPLTPTPEGERAVQEIISTLNWRWAGDARPNRATKSLIWTAQRGTNVEHRRCREPRRVL
jgi:epsilon-lactone hydrolase